MQPRHEFSSDGAHALSVSVEILDRFRLA